MANSTTNLDTISSSQAQKEVTANALIDAASPATFGGRQASATSALTWGYYGGAYRKSDGTINIASNGTLALTASQTNYVEFDPSAGTFSTNTTGWTVGKNRLYSVVTGTATITSYTDYRNGSAQDSGFFDPMTIIGGTVTASTPVINATQTWNAGGVTFTGIKLNVTDTASASGSLLMDLQKGGTSQFNIDKNGNVGVGVTPNVGGGSGMLQISGQFGNVGTGSTAFVNNSTGNDKYQATGPAAQYYMNVGAHYWRNAASGTAGTTISWSSPSLALDSNGNLLIGNPTVGAKLHTQGVSANRTARFDTNTSTATDTVLTLYNNATTGNNSFAEFGTEGSYTVRGSITFNRSGVLTAYNTTSDRDSKHVLGAIDDAVDRIMLLKPRRVRMVGATIDIDSFVADEVDPIAPYAVTGQANARGLDGNRVMQQLDASKLVPLLTAALQDHETRLRAAKL